MQDTEPRALLKNANIFPQVPLTMGSLVRQPLCANRMELQDDAIP